MSRGDGETEDSLGIEHTPTVEDSRRMVLKVIGMAGIGAGLTAVVAGPGAALVAYPLKHSTISGGTGFLPAGKMDQFPPGKPVKVDLFANKRDAWNRIVQIKVGSAWVINQGGKLTAYSTVCPHLGCAVDYDTDEKKFKCPCHHSAFGEDGTVLGGPAPRPLDRLETRVDKGNQIAIQYERYKQGAKEKEPV
jgi:menaquinol-cytochrome c reductase iron-sulfur subunit